MPILRRLTTGETISLPHPIEQPAYGELRDPADLVQAAAMEARDQLISKAPAAAEAWSLCESLNLRRSVVPIDSRTWAPTGPPFRSGDDVILHYRTHPADDVGIVTGPQADGWGLLALKDLSGGGWAGWVREHLTETQNRGPQFADKTEGRGYTVTTQRPWGAAVLVSWEVIPSEDPYHLPKTSAVLRGSLNDRQATLEVMRQMTSSARLDRWLLLPTLGAWRFKRRRLASDLQVLETGAVIPVWTVQDGQRCGLRNAGLLQSALPSDPGWWAWLTLEVTMKLGGQPA